MTYKSAAALEMAVKAAAFASPLTFLPAEIMMSLYMERVSKVISSIMLS